MQTINFDMLRIRDNDRILDLGCGEGRHAITAYMFNNIESVGVDLSHKDLNTTRNSFKEFEEPGNHNKCLFLSVADGTRLPFSDNCFDKIICSEVLEHIPDYRAVLREIFRVLKPGRIFTGTTFATPNVPFLDDDQNRLLSTLSRDLSASRPGTNGLRFWNSADLRDQLQSIGFSDVTILREKDYLFWKARKP